MCQAPVAGMCQAPVDLPISLLFLFACWSVCFSQWHQMDDDGGAIATWLAQSIKPRADQHGIVSCLLLFSLFDWCFNPYISLFVLFFWCSSLGVVSPKVRSSLAHCLWLTTISWCPFRTTFSSHHYASFSSRQAWLSFSAVFAIRFASLPMLHHRSLLAVTCRREKPPSKAAPATALKTIQRKTKEQKESDLRSFWTFVVVCMHVHHMQLCIRMCVCVGACVCMLIHLSVCVCVGECVHVFMTRCSLTSLSLEYAIFAFLLIHPLWS